MNESNVLVIYHAGCADGFCAAWLLHCAYPSAEFFPAHYGTPPPDVEGKDVFVVDFSYPHDVMVEMVEDSQSLVVLDHHKTAQKELEGLADKFAPEYRPEIIFDMDKSGGRLTWEWLVNNQPECLGDGISPNLCSLRAPPWLVNYTEDRDLWRHRLDRTKEVNANLRSHPFDFKLWDEFNEIELYSPEWQEWVFEGEAILRRERQIVDAHVQFAREIEMDSHKILAVNATVLSSEIAGELAKGKAFGACWFERKDGKRVWSLRSDEDGIDVSEVAKRRGGGGHKHTAGFEE